MARLSLREFMVTDKSHNDYYANQYFGPHADKQEPQHQAPKFPEQPKGT